MAIGSWIIRKKGEGTQNLAECRTRRLVLDIYEVRLTKNGLTNAEGRRACEAARGWHKRGITEREGGDTGRLAKNRMLCRGKGWRKTSEKKEAGRWYIKRPGSGVW